MKLSKTFRFEASHLLSRHPGKCSRLHGHSWVLTVSVEGPVNPETGFVMDFADISKCVEPLIERLDHRHLGEWNFEKGTGVVYSIHPNLGRVERMPLNLYPTSENLLLWIAGTLNIILLPWSELELEETCTSRAILTKREYAKTP